MKYESPFRQLSDKPCPQCGRIHAHFADCQTDALAVFNARLELSAEWVDAREAEAMGRYRWEHRT